MTFHMKCKRPSYLTTILIKRYGLTEGKAVAKLRSLHVATIQYPQITMFNFSATIAILFAYFHVQGSAIVLCINLYTNITFESKTSPQLLHDASLNIDTKLWISPH